MARVRPGWLVVLAGTTAWVSAWLPWLTTDAGGGGRASAIGGASGSLPPAAGFGTGQALVLLAAALVVGGALSARGLWTPWSAVATVLCAAATAGVTARYVVGHVDGTVGAAYGLHLGAAAVGVALLAALWGLVPAFTGRRR